MSAEQKGEVQSIAEGVDDSFDLDYVTAWYLKAAAFIQESATLVAFVSTNSITQGVQAGILWKHLIERMHVSIDFAYRTFVWESEARGKAHVHCVIVGFSTVGRSPKYIFDSDGGKHLVSRINPYLVDAPYVFVQATTTPVWPIPRMVNGNMPRDGGHFILAAEDRADIVAREPGIERYIRPYIGAEELINDKERYCLWLEDASPSEIRSSSILSERVRAVRDFRLASKAGTTNKYAETPSLFAQRPQPVGTDCLAIPRVSSERREYVPIGFMKAGTVLSDAVQVVPNATVYDFGILSSQMHNAWMRLVAGRLKSDYRYGRDIVYNTFPWPSPSADDKDRITHAAEQVLLAREMYPDASLADLYSPESMPPALVKAHKVLDRAVERAYGVSFHGDEQRIVAHLLEMYAEAVADR